jgi:hypothetical protein
VQNGKAIADRWFVRLLRTYPGQVARFMADETDQMRNPVGQTCRQSLGVLVVELLGGMNPCRVRKAIEAVMQIRAVSAQSASEAVSFIFELKEIVREDRAGALLDPLLDRIDEMALLAFDQYMEHRERLHEAQKNESRRRWYVLERVLSRPERLEWQERGAR